MLGLDGIPATAVDLPPRLGPMFRYFKPSNCEASAGVTGVVGLAGCEKVKYAMKQKRTGRIDFMEVKLLEKITESKMAAKENLLASFLKCYF